MLQVGGGADFLQEPLGADHRGQIGPEDFEGDLAVVPEILRQIDRRHATLAQLPLDPVTVREGRAEAGERIAHRFTLALSSANQLSTTRYRDAGAAAEPFAP